jgi:hypothetical protein
VTLTQGMIDHTIADEEGLIIQTGPRGVYFPIDDEEISTIPALLFTPPYSM